MIFLFVLLILQTSYRTVAKNIELGQEMEKAVFTFYPDTKTKNTRAPEKCLKFIAFRYGVAACYEVFNL